MDYTDRFAGNWVLVGREPDETPILRRYIEISHRVPRSPLIPGSPF